MTEKWEADDVRVYMGDGGISIHGCPKAVERARIISTAPEGLALARALVARSANGGAIMLWRELDMARAIVAKAGETA